MSAVYNVYCNRCGATATNAHESYQSLKNARRFTARVGWTHPERGRDLCPKCSEADREARAKALTENEPDYF